MGTALHDATVERREGAVAGLIHESEDLPGHEIIRSFAHKIRYVDFN